VPYEGRHLLLLRGVVGDHDRLRLPLPAGTKGLPIEQVERLWAHHWFWKRFVARE
jgi:hypothetical protein